MSISWRVSNEPVFPRVSGSPRTIKHWSLGTLGFCCRGSEEDFSAELLLRRFPCTYRYEPSDAVGLDGRGYGVGQAGRRMWKGLGNVMGKLGQGCRWAGVEGEHQGKVADGRWLTTRFVFLEA